MRGVFTIRRIDTHVHLAPVHRPYKTSYTELLRNRAHLESDVQDSKVKRWLAAEKTNLDVEASLLERWYPSETPCSNDIPPFKIMRDKLRGKMHSAFEYDMEVDGHRLIRVHRIVKRPLTKKNMEPFVSYLARMHNKRKRGMKALGPQIRSKLGHHDWSTFDIHQLRRITEMWFPNMEQRYSNIFRRAMIMWLEYEEMEIPVSSFLSNKCTKMDMVLSRARHYDDAISEQHTNTLDRCLEVYRSAARSTAFETIHWLGPWFSTATNEDLCCPTCLEPMTIPRVTACQHAFCNKCIQKYTKGCPICRQQIQPFGEWKKCLTWFDSSIQTRELAVQRGLAERQVRYVTEVEDDDEYVVVCCQEEDLWDWQYHFDNEQAYTLTQKPRASKLFLYQTQNWTLAQWEYLLEHWDVSVPMCIHGRVDCAVSFRGSLFRSLSGCMEESTRAPMGPVVTWDVRPEVDQYFVASSAAADAVHDAMQDVGKAWVLVNDRRRGVRKIVKKIQNNRYLFEDVPCDVHIDVKRYQADAVSIHRWPGGRVNVGAFVVTSNTKGCIPCAIRKAQANCVDICHVICLDCAVPPLHCGHSACKPTWRTCID